MTVLFHSFQFFYCTIIKREYDALGKGLQPALLVFAGLRVSTKPLGAADAARDVILNAGVAIGLVSKANALYHRGMPRALTVRFGTHRSECAIIKKNAIENPISHVSGRIRRKRQRLTANGSIETVPASVFSPRVCLIAGALPIQICRYGAKWSCS
jgi:hypothetical protein